MKNIILAVGALSLLSGCTTTVWVYEKQDKKTNEIKGIPFYTKKAVYIQKSEYAQTWLNAKLTITSKIRNKTKPDESIVNTQVFEKNIQRNDTGTLDIIRKKILDSGNLNIETTKTILSSFIKIDGISNFTSISKKLISNNINDEWVVNDDKTYYLNAPMPWFGSGNLTQELASDGTLSKVTSNPDTKIAEGISSLIPFKEYLTGKYVKTASEAVAELPADDSVNKILSLPTLQKKKDKLEIEYTISLNTIETGYIYSFSKTHDTFPEKISPIEPNINKNLFIRSPLTNNKKEAKKDKKPTIELSGTITLPKDLKK